MNLPTWLPNHAYIVGTRVTPVTPTTPPTTFWVLVAGTSAGTQPVWPTMEPWTVVDGGVTWGLASSFRQAAVAGVRTTLNAFKTANPTLLLQVMGSEPQSFDAVSKPFAYITGRDETMTLGNQLRTRTLAGLGVAVIDVVPNNVEAEARMDILIDGLVDAFTAAFHAIDGYSILQPVSVTEFLPAGGSTYIGNRISLASTFKTEGRS